MLYLYRMKVYFSEVYKDIENVIKQSIRNFDSSGKSVYNGNRNGLKVFECNNFKYCIKSFKKPNLINKIAYRYFRKSKACRSYEYASILKEKGIGTPEPIAFQENFDFIGLRESYYACVYLQYDLTYRELVETNYPDAENILRQFTQFTFDMHQKGIEFLDHSWVIP